MLRDRAVLAPEGLAALQVHLRELDGAHLLLAKGLGVLSNAVTKAAHSPDIKQRLLDQGAEPVGNRPEEFAKDFREELQRWAEVVRISGARAD